MFYIINFFRSVIATAILLVALQWSGVLPQLTVYFASEAAAVHQQGFMSIGKYNRKLLTN